MSLQPGMAKAASTSRPLVLWLHGCTQTAQEFLDLSQLQKVTESAQPVIYAPEQSRLTSPLKCWNWYLPSTQKRAEFLESMVSPIRSMIAQGLVDPNRVYVGGFSAGGVLAAHLAYCYPDVFSGVLIHSGAPYKALKTLYTPNGKEKLGEYAFKCARLNRAENKLKNVVIFHGTKDHIAPFGQGYNSVKQAYDYFDVLDDQSKNASTYLSSTERADGFDVYLKNDIQIHYFAIQGMRHAWSGSAPGMRFSSPDTLSATQTFFDLTNHFGNK